MKWRWCVDTATQLLILRGMAAAESRQGDLVFESLAIMTKFHQAMSNEVRLKEYTVALSCLERMEPVLHLALRNRILTTPQFVDLQSRLSRSQLSRISIAQQTDRASKAEIVGYLELWDYLKAAGDDEMRYWRGGHTP